MRNGGGDDTKIASGAGQASVLYADKPIPSGTTGDQAVGVGLVKTKSVEASRAAGALSDPTELAGKRAAANIPEGTVLTSSQFATPETSLGSVKFAPGKTALALSLGAAPGVAGFVAAGDHINIYGVLKEGPDSPSTKLIMQNTEVLSVSPSGPAVAVAPPGTNPTFLLAATATEAERLVFYTSFDSLYFSLVSKDAVPTGPTPGSGVDDALKQLS